jgi:cellulose synthase/poly-beta-1,6-N-acetylglucosamine synthase-like glycosyltransferase
VTDTRPLPAAMPPRTRPRRVLRSRPGCPGPARVLITSATAVVLGTLGTVVMRSAAAPELAAYWILGALVILACLTCNAVPRSWAHLPVAPGRVLAVIPTYQEPQASLDAGIWSLINQTCPPDRIVVVDDGSSRPPVPWYHPLVEWVFLPQNRGKRGAHVAGLSRYRAGEFAYVLTVDSDSHPRPDAVEHLLRAMSDRRVQAATGWIRVRNYADSWVARAADIDIGGSCVMMRASRSWLGALETTSGALALYRAPVIYDNLAEYAIECGTGDDRWLALRALLRGEVVAVNDAMVDTDMPPTVRGTYRQRIRWARSWWWMLPFVFTRLSGRRLISPAYGLAQLAILPAILGYAAWSWTDHLSARASHPTMALAYLGAYLTVRFALAALYLTTRDDMPPAEVARSLILGTLGALALNIALLTPVRYLALAKWNDNRWQSRGLT